MPASPSAAIRSEINVTPLVDVVLVLLIIFMVIAPLLHGYRVALPEAGPRAASFPVVVRVDRGGTVRLGDDVVELASLPTRLGPLVGVRPAPIVMLEADGELDYGQTLRILDAIRRSGADRIGIDCGAKETLR
jgi:biopolymer transport protein TolR